jgi:hypothetical protein
MLILKTFYVKPRSLKVPENDREFIPKARYAPARPGTASEDDHDCR